MTVNPGPPGLETPQGLNGTTKKPRVLACASPFAGHTVPVLRASEALAQRGYDVTMIAGAEYVDTISKFPARPVVCDPVLEETMETRTKIPAGIERFTYDMNFVGILPTKSRMGTLYSTLETMHEEDPESDIVIITETFFLGTHPMYLGAELPKGFTKRPRTINLHAMPYFIKSIDTGPVGMALLPDSTKEGRERMAQLRLKALKEEWSRVIDTDEENMRSLGAVNYRRDVLWELWMTSHDITLQMCHPGLEFDRPDWHPKVHFIGALPRKPIKKDQVYPPFWNEVIGDKKIIVVTQGTVATDYSKLIIPTLQALAGRDDLVVIGLLGVKGASLPKDVDIPSNAYILDYFPYDTLLPHASVFIFNAGYGGFIHGVINGVPMVLAGDTEEKPEVAVRAEYSGLGVNLRTGTPTKEQVSEAVNKVLEDPSYKEKVTYIMRENEKLDATDAIERAVLKMAAIGPA